MVGEYFILYCILLYCMITLLRIWELIKQMVPTHFVVVSCLVSNAFGCRLGHPLENMPAAGRAKTWNMNVFTQMSSVDRHVFMPTCGGRRVSLWAKSKATSFVLSCTQCPSALWLMGEDDRYVLLSILFGAGSWWVKQGSKMFYWDAYLRQH